MDMRGFNDSDKPSGIENYFIMNMATDIKELVTGLGKKKFTLVAHDWGGAVSCGHVTTCRHIGKSPLLPGTRYPSCVIEGTESWEEEGGAVSGTAVTLLQWEGRYH